MAFDAVIAEAPPNDGRGWQPYCARCGSSLEWRECWKCAGEGVDGHDCGEDTCCCLHPEENIECDICDGAGGWLVCMSNVDWCAEHPLPGRETAGAEGSEIEWVPTS